MIVDPQVGDFLVFKGLGKDFYYVVLDTSDEDDILLGSMNEGEVPKLAEYRDSFKRKNKWKKL